MRLQFIQMHRYMIWRSFWVFVWLLALQHVSSAQVKSAIAWKDFLTRNDMVFDTLTTVWEEGAFTGNGLLGAMIYMKDANTLRMDIGRTDVTDRRAANLPALYAKSRLPVGHFILRPVGKIKRITARVNLWDAEINGNIVTDKGTIEFKQLTLSQTNIIYLSTHFTGEENNFKWEFLPEAAISPRLQYDKQPPANYIRNPAGIASIKGTVHLYHQPLIMGGGYATAWREIYTPSGRDYFITIANAVKDNEALITAYEQVADRSDKNFDHEIVKHRKWWHAYYRQSFISVPDSRIESFYWIQQYKMASATREDKPALDLMGPWFRTTPWPAYWYNLNIQLTYSSLYTANRLNTAASLIHMVDNASSNLVNNILEPYRQDAAGVGRAGGIDMSAVLYLQEGGHPEVNNGSAELGNLTWILYYYWQHYRYSMDKSMADKLFPLLKRSINLYLHFLKKNEHGKWEMSIKTYSPEYEKGYGYNTNYDLSLLRWGCQTLLQLNDELQHHDRLAVRWKDVLENLIPYPQDETGYMIATGIPLTSSHRHYSHLLMIYPLHLVNWDQAANREVILKSLTHWHSFPNALYGYSFTGGASMYATMGKGNQARDYLHQLLQKFIKPNTMYLESGPVIETPLAACATIQEMYVQYWNNMLRIFPAVPDDWKDAAFENLRTEGAFLVSAVRKDYATKWIKLESLYGGTLLIQPGFNGAVKVKSMQNVKCESQGGGRYTLHMAKGAVAILYTNEKDLKHVLNDVNITNIRPPVFGKKTK